jgi:hypothetical protein
MKKRKNQFIKKQMKKMKKNEKKMKKMFVFFSVKV